MGLDDWLFDIFLFLTADHDARLIRRTHTFLQTLSDYNYQAAYFSTFSENRPELGLPFVDNVDKFWKVGHMADRGRKQRLSGCVTSGFLHLSLPCCSAVTTALSHFRAISSDQDLGSWRASMATWGTGAYTRSPGKPLCKTAASSVLITCLATDISQTRT